MPARKTDKTSRPAARKPAKRTAARGKAASTLPEAMTGRASPAKAAVGDKPVFAYIASLPQPQRGIAESVDALAAKTLSRLQRVLRQPVLADPTLTSESVDRRKRTEHVVNRLRSGCAEFVGMPKDHDP